MYKINSSICIQYGAKSFNCMCDDEYYYAVNTRTKYVYVRKCDAPAVSESWNQVRDEELIRLLLLMSY